MEQLSVLETIQEITGFLMVQVKARNFTSLSFLKNLRIIHGREVDLYVDCLFVHSKQFVIADCILQLKLSVKPVLDKAALGNEELRLSWISVMRFFEIKTAMALEMWLQIE